MSLPTTGSVSVQIDAPPAAVYELVADITNMGRWSPECHSCVWLDEPGKVGSRFKGSNRRGFLRWSTTPTVIEADPGKVFSFATMAGERESTRWTYRFDGDQTTTLTESFEVFYTPPPIRLAVKLVMRDRQQQLEAGMRKTLDAIKAAAEAPTS